MVAQPSAGADLQAAVYFRFVGGGLGRPGGSGCRAGDVQLRCDLHVGLRAEQPGTVGLGQYLLCRLVQFDALAQQLSIPDAQIEEVLLEAASRCNHQAGRRLVGDAEHPAGCVYDCGSLSGRAQRRMRNTGGVRVDRESVGDPVTGRIGISPADVIFQFGQRAGGDIQAPGGG